MAITCPKCDLSNPDTSRFCADCGTQLSFSKDIRPEVTETIQTPVKELTTGSTFAGRYQIIEELGKGGMGKVYRALDKTLNEEVALKLIRPEIALDETDARTVPERAEDWLAKSAIAMSAGCSTWGRKKACTSLRWSMSPGEDLRSSHPAIQAACGRNGRGNR